VANQIGVYKYQEKLALSKASQFDNPVVEAIYLGVNSLQFLKV
jgi:hypothetical protein